MGRGPPQGERRRSRTGRRARPLIVALGAAAGSLVAVPAAAEQQPTEAGGRDPDRDQIVVYGQRASGVFEGAAVEDELSEEDVATYGLNNVGEVLEEINADVDDSGDGPVVLINGQPASGLSDVAKLPTEAVSRIQLLNRGAAPHFGAQPGRRVINVVVKPNFRQATFNGQADASTRGGGRDAKGEANLTRIADGNRTTLDLEIRDADALTEAQRAIVTATAGAYPYDLAGNIVGAAGPGSEIDPMLSAAAGFVTTAARVPVGVAHPTLADFALGANQRNATDLGTYRTLVPRLRSYNANFSLNRKLGERTLLSLTADGQLDESADRVGAASALVLLPGTSPFSPFSRDVEIARYLGDPLRQSHRSGRLNLAAALNRLGDAWRLSLLAGYTRSESDTDTERGLDTAQLQTQVANGTLNPFAELPAGLVERALLDTAHSRSDKGFAQFHVSGSPLALPTGSVRLTLRLGASTERFDSHGIVRAIPRASGFQRDEVNGQVAADIPLTGGKFTPALLGDLTATLAASFRRVTGAGTLGGYSYGLRWSPAMPVTLRGSVNFEEIPPSPQILSAPVVVTDAVRVFDFLRNETVAVTYITGGNPSIRAQSRRTTRVSADWNLLPRRQLVLSAEYSRVLLHDGVAGLPPVSASVQAAFPDRYQRNAAGQLVLVDARAVSFARDEREQIHWGITFRRRLSSKAGSFSRAGGDVQDIEEEGIPLRSSALQAGVDAWRIVGSVGHTWTLTSTRLARPGLGTIDLLAGGAAGYGGGQRRHAVDFDLAVAGRGVGLRLDGQWTGPSTVRSGTAASPSDLRFAARLKADGELFADLGRLAPNVDWLDRTRVSLFGTNLTGSKQRVRDAAGAVPLGYQPFLLDPLGRTLGIKLRKAF